MDELCIKLERTIGGYMVNIFCSSEGAYLGDDPLDGGLCETENIIEAAQFGTGLVEDWLKNNPN